jgi:hypothetical protein
MVRWGDFHHFWKTRDMFMDYIPVASIIFFKSWLFGTDPSPRE